MVNFKYCIRLVSDAETSSGLGSDVVDGLVARDINGKPFVPATHIKGLMRQVVKDLPSSIIADDVKQSFLAVFGIAGANKDYAALFSVTDALSDSAQTRLITRTALNEFGVAKDTSLRTNEAVCAGSMFKGDIHLGVESKMVDLLIRYALLSIYEIGGSRNRGAGACVVTIENEKRTPGQILKELLLLNSFEIATETNVVSVDDACETVFAKLTFVAESSVCVPELPIVGNNTIISGFSISSSAVQGCILTKINALNESVASATFKAENFRTWPLLPVPDEPEYANCFAVRVSASHKISKLADENGYNFCDEMIEPYKWEERPKNAPIKSVDGVLVAGGSKGTVLWRSGDMARHLTAHGVVNGGATGDERAFYTVESLAEKRFVGFVAMPKNAFVLLRKALDRDPLVSFGKSRTVRGTGRLSINEEPLPLALPRAEKTTHETVAAFIVQSPILVSPDITAESADEILKEMVTKARWGEVDKASASIQILFGWNRHKNGLQKAEKVIAPGSVFSLKNSDVHDLEQKLLKGIGEGKERGFGAVLPHPNIAQCRYIPSPVHPSIKSSSNAAEYGWKLWKTSRGSGNPLSSSQVAQLIARISADKLEARKYLETQLLRPDKIWERWKYVMEDVEKLLMKEPDYIQTALSVWHNLSVAEV